MKAVSIMWDSIEDRDLPLEVDIPSGISPEEVEDYLSDIYGDCVLSYILE